MEMLIFPFFDNKIRKIITYLCDCLFIANLYKRLEKRKNFEKKERCIYIIKLLEVNPY